MGARKTSLQQRDTYVFIDVSNIRLACSKTLGLWLDFVKLSGYFQKKYPNLKDMRYYEGISRDDEKKQKSFEYLAKKGYTICPLTRKSYNSVETEEYDVKCPRCGNEWKAEFSRERKIMKSNVDVYLATELLTIAHTAASPIHIILVSCDGDYAEMIKNALGNPNVTISVLATPFTRNLAKNTLSVRLKQIKADYRAAPDRYYMRDITDVNCFSERS